MKASDGGEENMIVGYKLVSGSWKMKGNGRIAEVDVRTRVENYITATNNTPKGYVENLQVRVRDYQGYVQSVAVNGSGLATGVDKTCDTALNYDPYLNCKEHNAQKEFDYKGSISAGLGSIYTVTITKTDNSTYTYPYNVIC